MFVATSQKCHYVYLYRLKQDSSLIHPNHLKREISVAGTSNVYVAVFIIVSPFLSANIRVFGETTKFLGCFFD